MITLHWVYALAGAIFAAFALLGVNDTSNPRARRTAAFWALLALSMWAGDSLGDLGNGVLVLGLVALAASGLGRGSGMVPDRVRQERAGRFGNGLFAIALVLGAVVIGTALDPRGTSAAGSLESPSLETRSRNAVLRFGDVYVAYALHPAPGRPCWSVHTLSGEVLALFADEHALRTFFPDVDTTALHAAALQDD